jgi:hypothetical protein
MKTCGLMFGSTQSYFVICTFISFDLCVTLLNVDWIDLAQDRDSWQAFIKTIGTFWLNAGNLLASWVPVSFLGRTLFHGFIYHFIGCCDSTFEKYFVSIAYSIKPMTLAVLSPTDFQWIFHHHAQRAVRRNSQPFEKTIIFQHEARKICHFLKE